MPSEQDDGKRPPHVKRVKGRWFWDPPDKLRRSHNLKTKPLGADQAAAWALARTLNRDHLQLGPGAPAIGTVRWLLEAFLVSDRFVGLAPSTQQDYRWLARRVLAPAPIGNRMLGEVMATAIKPRHADALYAGLRAAHGHASAHYACRLARRIWKWGHRRDMVDAVNPWSGMELRGIPQRTARWSPDEVAAVIRVAGECGRASIGLAVLAAYSFGHRQADVLGLTWADLKAGRVLTGKTGVELPVVTEAYPELHQALRAERARQEAVAQQREGVVALPTHVLICEMTGSPWQQDTFRHEFRRIADLAGVPPELQFRDLRATAMTEMSDGGADVIHMATHSGHKTVAMARRYARPTAAQFASAAGKRPGRKSET